jgi:glycosyltransferase involved in cell wall biosynthesis
MKTADIFKQLNFPLQVEFCRNDSLVSRARNNLIARAMSDPKTTHILFIDSDITWHPFDVLKLVIANKPIVGGSYPLKAYKWDKLKNPETGKFDGKMMESWIEKKNNNEAFRNMIDDKNMILYNLLHYNINYLSNTLTIDQNLTKVKHLATGFMMIQRSTLEKMMKAFPSTKYVDDVGFLQEHENTYAYALFDCGVEEGHYFSEDWLFCKRWSKMGGDVWLDVSINLIHTGIEDFKGCYVASLL